MIKQWFVEEFIGGENGIDSPHIDGFFFDDNWGRQGASEMDIHNLEDTGLTPAEHEDMHAAWQVNTAAVGERVLAKGGFAVPYFTAMQRFGNMSDRDSIQAHCNRDMATVCKVNQSTGKPNIHGQAMLHEFTRYPLSLWSSNGTLPYVDQVSAAIF